MAKETLINYEGHCSLDAFTQTVRGFEIFDGHLLPSEARDAIWANLEKSLPEKYPKNQVKLLDLVVLIVHHFEKQTEGNAPEWEIPLNDSDYISIKEAVKISGFTQQTIRNAAKDGRVGRFYYGARPMYLKADVLALKKT